LDTRSMTLKHPALGGRSVVLIGDVAKAEEKLNATNNQTETRWQDTRFNPVSRWEERIHCLCNETRS